MASNLRRGKRNAGKSARLGAAINNPGTNDGDISVSSGEVYDGSERKSSEDDNRRVQNQAEGRRLTPKENEIELNRIQTILTRNNLIRILPEPTGNFSQAPPRGWLFIDPIEDSNCADFEARLAYHEYVSVHNAEIFDKSASDERLEREELINNVFAEATRVASERIAEAERVAAERANRLTLEAARTLVAEEDRRALLEEQTRQAALLLEEEQARNRLVLPTSNHVSSSVS